jgi:phage head maturation protease
MSNATAAIPIRKQSLAAVTDPGRLMTGHFAVWNTKTIIRGEGPDFIEEFAPTSMDRTLAEDRQVVMWEHGRDPSIGRKLLGEPVTLRPDRKGAFYEVQLFRAPYVDDLIPGLRAGVYGASHRFSVVRDEYRPRAPKSSYNPRGIAERRVTEAVVKEFGPVIWGAYETATAGMRSRGRTPFWFVNDPNPDNELFWFADAPTRSKREIRGWRTRSQKTDTGTIRWRERDLGRDGWVERVFTASRIRYSQPVRIKSIGGH